eukprot:m.102619 g.102619  ORF g.102619 m.102619 type:complete len:713 (-) comp9082_c0_seq1:1348-3486(-)
MDCVWFTSFLLSCANRMGDGGIVWKDSPLYKYLEDIGEDVTGIGVERLEHETVLPSISSGCDDFSFDIAEDGSNTEMMNEAQKRLICLLLESPHLHDEDAMFLTQLDPKLTEDYELFTTVCGGNDKIAQGNVEQPRNLSIASPSSSFFVSLVALSTASLVGLAFRRAFPLRSLSSLLFLSTSMGIGAGSIAWLARKGGGVFSSLFKAENSVTPSDLEPSHAHDLIKHIQNMLNERQEFVVACHAAYSTIQQVELLRRGFGLGTSLLPPISRMEQEDAKNRSSTEVKSLSSLHLRLCLRQCLLNSIKRIRNITLTFSRVYPLHPALQEGSWLFHHTLTALGVGENDDCNNVTKGNSHTPSIRLAELKHLFDLEVLHFSELLRYLLLRLSPRLCGTELNCGMLEKWLLHENLIVFYCQFMKENRIAINLARDIETVWTRDLGVSAPPSCLPYNLQCIRHNYKDFELQQAKEHSQGYKAYAHLMAEATLSSSAIRVSIKQLHDLVRVVFFEDHFSEYEYKEQAIDIIDRVKTTLPQLEAVIGTIEEHVHTWDWEDMRLATVETGDELQQDDFMNTLLSESDLLSGTKIVDGSLSGFSVEEALDADFSTRKTRPVEMFEGTNKKRTAMSYFDDAEDDEDEENTMTEEERVALWRQGREERLKMYEKEREAQKMKDEKQKTTKSFMSELQAVLGQLPQREQVTVTTKETNNDDNDKK